jgi:hypothetical protein
MGYLWINRHLLGRYWKIGLQQRLYCPASWLRRGDNELLVFDLIAPRLRRSMVSSPCMAEISETTLLLTSEGDGHECTWHCLPVRRDI